MKNFLMVLLLLITGGIFSQPFAPRVDSTGKYPYTYYLDDPMKVRVYTLKNGLTVMMSVNKAEPRIYTCVAVRAGSKNDPRDNTGLAHYLEHMLFKGTDRFGSADFEKEQALLQVIDSYCEQYNREKNEDRRKAIYRKIDSVSTIASQYAIANEYDKMVQVIGAKGTNAFTSSDETVYINDIPSNRLESWIKIEGERFRNPVLRLFHTELEAVYEEKNMSLDNDGFRMYEAVMASLFNHHTYGLQTTIGTVEHLKNPSLKKIRQYYSNYYVPNNMAITLAGDLDPEKTIELIDKAFGSMQPVAVPEYKFEKEKPAKEPKTVTIKGPESEYVAIAYRLPGARAADVHILELCMKLLSNSVAGLIDLNLIKDQKVLDAEAWLDVMNDYSVMFMIGRPKSGQTLDQVKDLLLAQLDSLKQGKFDPALLKAVVYNEQIDDIREMQSNSSRAFKMQEAFTKRIGWDRAAGKTVLLSRVSKNDIVKKASEWFGNDFTIAYKLQGADSTIQKIEKPPITAVNLNREGISTFAKDIMDDEVKAEKPRFIDFEKDITHSEIKPGLPLLHVKNNENKLFTLYYVFDFGRLNNREMPIALSLLEYLGTNKMNARKLSMEFYKMACDFNVVTGDEQMYISLSGPDEMFERAMAVLEHLLSSAVPDQEALEALIDDMLQEREDNLHSKDALFNALRNYSMYGKENPVTWVLSKKQLKQLKADKLTDLVKQLCSYEHRIMYYGPRMSEDVSRVMARYHITPEKLLPAPRERNFKMLPHDKPQVFFTNYDMVQAEIGWVKNSGSFDVNEYPSVQLFNEYFGSGMSSVVFQTIRESKALAYSSYAYFGRPSKSGKPQYVMGFIGTQADKLDSAVAAMTALLNKMPVSEISFQSAKNALKSNIESQRILRSQILFQYLQMEKLGLKHDIRKDVYEKLPGLTTDSINAFHTKYFSNKPFTLYVMASKDRVKPSALSAYGKVKTLKRKALFGY